MKWKRTVTKNGASLQIIIPKDLASFLNIKEGDNLIVINNNESSFTVTKDDDEDTEPTSEV